MDRHFSILLLILYFASIVHAQAETEPAQSASEQATKAAATSIATKFVSDELTVMLRAGPSNKHKIIRALTTGIKLDVLESKGKYDHVRTKSGLQGWVLSQHLTKKPLAKHLLTKAEQKIDNLEKKIKDMREQMTQLKENYNKLKEEHRVLDKSKTEIEEELTQIRGIAAQPLKLSNEKKALTEQTETLSSQVDTLQEELATLRTSSQKQWFLTGAAVVLLGILIGLTIPKMRRHRRSDWSSSL